jgi:hypothetical protein
MYLTGEESDYNQNMPHVEINVQPVAERKSLPSIYKVDSVSTFNPATPSN